MQTGLAVLISILLGAVLTFGSCAGVDTSQIEDLADSYGIEPIEVSMDDLEDVYGDYAYSGEEAAAEAGTIGMPNPWTTVADAQAAAEGAGYDSFIAPEGFLLSLGEPYQVTYSYTDGIAQALFDYPASSVTVRKAYYAGDGDISGDYRAYNLTWNVDVDGIGVQCYGNVDGQACKATFVSGDYMYAIVTMGLGGEDDFGLGAADLEAIVGALR